MMEMTWLLMWFNVSIATLNATLQLLVIYRLYYIRVFVKLELLGPFELNLFLLKLKTENTIEK